MIRDTRPSETPELLELHRAAFVEEPEVADLVSDVLDDPTAAPLVSLVYEEDGRIVGHVLVSAAHVDGVDRPVGLLAPLAVVPDRQGHGIGQALVAEAVVRARDAGLVAIFVLGHPTYYPKCGFSPVGPGGPAAPYPVPEDVADAWMLLELEPGIRAQLRGTLRPADTLMREEYWRE